MIYELPIKSSYVPSWGGWECIREAIQNGLDEDDRGYPLSIEYKKDYLRIFNRGANISTKALLIGHTDKDKDNRLRGQHGEGLDLCFLAGIRAGYNIEVFTQDEIWRPSLKYSDNYGEEILIVTTRKRREIGPGVEVCIKVPKEDWEETQRLFLSIVKPKNSINLSKGTVIIDEEYKGMLFVKGIFVQKRKDLVYGYNLNDAKLDRDRRIIDDWDLKYKLASLYQEAIENKHKDAAALVYNMLKNGADDVKGMQYYYMSSDIKEVIADEFLKEHGDQVIPVNDIKSSNDINHAGKTGIVVNDTLKEVLKSTKIESFEKVTNEYRNSKIKTYSWHELEQYQKDNFNKALSHIEKTLNETTEFICEEIGISKTWTKEIELCNINIVDFNDKTLNGLYVEDENVIELSIRRLSNYYSTIKTLIHEIGHYRNNEIQNHSKIVEELWVLIYRNFNKNTI